MGAQLLSQLLTATELVPQSLFQAEKGQSTCAQQQYPLLDSWGTHYVDSRVPAYFSARWLGSFCVVGVHSWLVGAGWLGFFCTRVYVGVILFFIKEMDPA